jgi:hypothetical protein
MREKALALPVAEKASSLLPQRSKNRRPSVSPNGFSGTARRIRPLQAEAALLGRDRMSKNLLTRRGGRDYNNK